MHGLINQEGLLGGVRAWIINQEGLLGMDCLPSVFLHSLA